jgi:hypothetical protein
VQAHGQQLHTSSSSPDQTQGLSCLHLSHTLGILGEGLLLALVPVFVKVPLEFITETLSPDGVEGVLMYQPTQQQSLAVSQSESQPQMSPSCVILQQTTKKAKDHRQDPEMKSY